MKIAIMGATGVVGQEMLNALVEENIDVTDLRLLASKRSVGKKVLFKNKEYSIEELNEKSFEGMDIVLGAVDEDISRMYAPFIKKTGAVYIDNSSAFRLDEDVPLVVPEINGEDVKKHNGIIANPNCSTIITCMAVYPISKLSPIKSIIASTYQAVSGAGKGGIDELAAQITAIENGEEFTSSVFPYQIAYNCIPMIGSNKLEGYTSEEMKLENEGRKIMHLPNMNVTCTCVRVPVIRSHSISVSLQCEKPLSVEEVRKAISEFEHVKLVDDIDNKLFPMPIDTSNQNDIFVGRIRKDRVFDGGISLFCAGDQIRKGAATNAVQIIKCL